MDKDQKLIFEAYLLKEGNAKDGAAWLQKYIDSGYQLGMHQTHPHVAKQIITKHEGFDGGPNLGGTSHHPVSTEHLMKMLQNQQTGAGYEGGVHRSSTAILIYVVPNNGYRKPDDISDALLDQETTILPDNYIAGYFDAETDNFVANGRFNPSKGVLSQK